MPAPFPELAGQLFHGSTVEVRKIDLSLGVREKDFGRGFYTTSIRRQAGKFARIKAARAGIARGVVSVFDFADNPANKILRFEKPDGRWLDFILFNRGFSGGKNPLGPADIVIGPVANDAVGLVLNQLLIGTYGDSGSQIARATAIRLLETQKLHNQVFIGTARAAGCLKFRRAYEVDR